MAGTFRLDIDPQELGAFVRDMREMEGGAKVVNALRRNLRAAAGPAAAQVRSNASWSTRIPAAVAVRVAFTAKRGAGVSVVVNRRKAPHARPFENFGDGGSFQHFTFGKQPIINQTARPFFFDEMQSVMPAVERAAAAAVDEAAQAVGFR